MSNTDWLNDDDEDEDDTPPASETDLVKQLRKLARKQEKELKDLRDFQVAQTKKERENIVKQILETKGVSPKAARLILNDLSEVDENSVNNWLTENDDLFVKKVVDQDADQSDPNLDALEQQDQAARSGRTPSNGNSLMAQLDDPNLSESDFQRLIMEASQ